MKKIVKKSESASYLPIIGIRNTHILYIKYLYLYLNRNATSM